MLPDISRLLLSGMAEGRKMTTLRVGVAQDGSFVYS
jgi:hypothetical protein